MTTKSYSAHDILDREFKGQTNFITPSVVEVGKVHPQIAYELSTGKVGLYVLWGATFAGVDEFGNTWRAVSPFSSCFENRAAAEAHIYQVKEFLLCGHLRRRSVLSMFLLAMVLLICQETGHHHYDDQPHTPHAVQLAVRRK